MINRLVFKGGGITGIAYFGALRALHRLKIIDLYHAKLEFCGTSVGALIATLCCIRFPIMDAVLIKTIVQFCRLCGEFNLVKCVQQKGLNDGQQIKQFVLEILLDQTGLRNPTFRELYRLSRRRLVIGATSLKTHSAVYFSTKYTPTVSVADALLASMAIFPIFSPVTIQFREQRKSFPRAFFPATIQVGGQFAFHDMQSDCCYEIESIGTTRVYVHRVTFVQCVDGCFTDNAPWAFDLDERLDRDTPLHCLVCSTVQQPPPNQPTTTSQSLTLHPYVPPEPMGITKTIAQIFTAVSTHHTTTHDRFTSLMRTPTPDFIQKQTVEIPTTFKGLQFNLSPADIQQLIQDGEQYVLRTRSQSLPHKRVAELKEEAKRFQLANP